MTVVGRIDPADAGGARALIVGIQRDEYGFDITLEDQPDLRDEGLFDDDGFYVVGGGGFWVARDGGHVIGTIGLHDCGDGVAALRKMFVAPDHRGAREDGEPIAARLLDALVEHARGAGFDSVYLGTTERFAAAHRFYEKQGFRPLDPSQLPSAFPRMALDSRFYVLELGRRYHP
jgi:N-acetylglutamate synthase-like GNAT family acetyltransferase